MLGSTSNLSGNGLPSQKTSIRSTESDMEIGLDAVNPLNVLISAAKTRNPMQYQLPSELSCTVQLPGNLSNLFPFECILYNLRYDIKSYIKNRV